MDQDSLLKNASPVVVGTPAPLTMGRVVDESDPLARFAEAKGLVMRERVYLSQILCGAVFIRSRGVQPNRG